MTHEKLAKVIADAIQKNQGEVDTASIIEQVLHEKWPGPTGKFPDGKLNVNDGGELAIAVGISVDKKVVIIDFGKSISWFGVTPESCVAFIDMLQKTVNKIIN